MLCHSLAFLCVWRIQEPQPYPFFISSCLVLYAAPLVWHTWYEKYHLIFVFFHRHDQHDLDLASYYPEAQTNFIRVCVCLYIIPRQSLTRANPSHLASCNPFTESFPQPLWLSSLQQIPVCVLHCPDKSSLFDNHEPTIFPTIKTLYDRCRS